MQPPAPSVFDSLVEPGQQPPVDAALLMWLVNSILRSGSEQKLKDFVDDMRAQKMGGALDSWLGSGTPRPIDAAQLKNFVGTDKLLDATQLATLANNNKIGEDELLQRFAELLPEAVRVLMPRGEVPSWRALEPGLNSLLKSLRSSASPSQAR
jgi:uncharacterized protein YidB (DUF937 family)